MKNKKDFKYTTTIGAELLPSKIKSDPSIIEAKASALRRLTPYLNMKDHQDLFGAAFEIALINQFNENGDGIASEDCLQLTSGFRMKQLNLEHDRTMIIGHVLEGTFCERAFGKELYYEDIVESGKKNVFSLVLSSVIYKLANEQLTNILSSIVEGQNEEDENEKIYASWEIGFNQYDIAIGGRLVSECEIISDPEKKESYKQYIKATGGSGRLSDGRYVQRLINGEILPLGGALTTNPAANVKGIYVIDPSYYGEAEPKEVVAVENADTEGNNQENNKKIDNETSQSAKDNVTKNETDIFSKTTQKEGNKNMNEEQVKKLIQEAFASKTKDSEKEEAIASVTNRILEAIKEGNDVYIAEKKELSEEKEQAEAKVQEQESKINDLEKSVETFKGDLAKASEELDKMKEEGKKLEAQATFDSRMDEIKSIYVLDDSVSEIVAKRLVGVSEEQYEDLKKEFAVTLAHITKEAVEAKEKKEEEAKASLNSDEETIKKDPIEEGGEEEKTSVANNSEKGSEEEETLQQKFAKAFTKESVLIK